MKEALDRDMSAYEVREGNGGGGGGGGSTFKYVQPQIFDYSNVTATSSKEKNIVRLDPREKDGTFTRQDDPLLRREPLIWGGSNDALAALTARGNQILASLPLRPNPKTKTDAPGPTKGASGKLAGVSSDVQKMFAEFDDGTGGATRTATGRPAIGIPTPVPVASGGESLGLMLAVIGIIATIAGILYYEYKHKKNA